MRFLVSAGYAWNRLRTLVLGLSRELLILANNLNLRFVGNATVITQQIRDAWDSYGLPFPQMLLNAAWLHNEEISDTEIVDENPNVDASRTWHKARALQFTGAEHIDIPYQLDLTQRYKFTYEFICTEHNNWETIIDSRVQSIDRSFSNYIRPDRTVTVNTQYGQLNFDPVITGCRYLVTIEHNGSEITATLKNTTLDTSQTLSNSTLAYTPDTAETFFRIGAAPYGTSNLRQRLGYFKYEEDGITLIEYAFEEGEGTTCYNRVMNNFHGTINNATISTFRVEDVRITNGDQGTFLNTDGYSPLNVYTSDFSSGIDGMIQSRVTASSVDGISDGTTSKDDVLQVVLTSGSDTHYVYRNGIFDLSNSYDVSFEYYIPSVRPDGVTPQTIDSFVVRTGTGTDGIYAFSVVDSWQSETIQNWSPTSNNSLLFLAAVGEFIGSIDADGDVYYVKNIVVTQPNVYVPRPRVTDIPLYNTGKYGYYIPDHTSNYINLNTAFAGFTNPGDWMEFGIATVGTGEPTGQLSWAVSIDGSDSSSFYLGITNADTRFYSSSGRVQVTDADAVNEDFYSFRITKDQNVTSSVVDTGTIEIFDRDGNLITSYPLTSGPSGNEGTYIYDRFFPSAYGTDFILAYLKLSDGTVWNGANDFNGGVNIANSGTGNVTKIFFESVDEDVLGNPLTYKGQVAQPLSLVNSNGALFSSGVRAEWDSSQIFDLDDFTMVWYAYLDEDLRVPSDYREAFSGITSDYLFYFRTGSIYFRANNVNSANKPFLEGNIPDADFINKWQKFSFTRSASNNIATFTAGDVVRTVNLSETAGLSFEFKSFGDLGQEGLEGQLAWASVHSKLLTPSQVAALDPYNMDTDSLEVFLVPSVGSGSTVYDVSGNNRHATVTGATLSNFWIKQDKFHWNLKKGFSLYDDDATGTIIQRVPLGLNPTISGYTKVSDNPAGKWHNDAETEINFPHTAKLHMINEQFDYKPFFYKNAQLEDATAAYSMRKVIADYEGPLLNVVRSSDLQAQDFYPDSRGDLDTTAITNFVNEATPVLDDYSGAAAAYSLRKVRSAYTGSAINVRRSSDDTTQDIGFDANGDLDTTALTTFVNAEITDEINTTTDSNSDGLADGLFSSGSATTSIVTGNGHIGSAQRVDYNTSGSTLQTFQITTLPPIIGQEITISFMYRSNFIIEAIGNAYSNGGTAFKDIPANTGDAIRFEAKAVWSPTGGNDGRIQPMWLRNAGEFLEISDWSVTYHTADGHVTTWYDQAGSNNATNSTPDQQPLIVSGGSLITRNGSAAVQADGVDDILSTANSILSTDFGVFAVAGNNNLGNSSIIALQYGSSISSPGGTVFGASQFSGFTEVSVQIGTYYSITGAPTPDQHLYYYNRGGSSLDFAWDGEVPQNQTNSNVIDNAPLELFGTSNFSFYTETFIQELIIFTSDQSTNRAGIEANIGRYYSIDGFADGRVATWYDQANANHATQSNPDNQPLIVDGGTLVTEGGKASIHFGYDGSTPNFLTNSTISKSGDIDTAIFSVHISLGGSGNYIYDGFNSPDYFGHNNASRGVTFNYSSQLPDNVHQLITRIGEVGGLLSVYKNGLLHDSGAGGIVGDDGVTIGTTRSTTVYQNSKQQELIIFNSDQSTNRQDIEKNIADYYEITLSGNSGVESWVKNVSFADMYQSWFDYEYLHKLFANFEVPNQVNKILAYVTELTIEQRETIVYPYLKEDYHPIYTPYQQRVQADSGDTDAGQTNTLNKIDNI